MNKPVTKIPLEELFSEDDKIRLQRVRYLDNEQLKILLQSSDCRLVLADCGKSLVFVPARETFAFWKSEIKARLHNPQQTDIVPDLHPGSYCFLASEWTAANSKTLILLEKYH